ncbi:MAG TPA: NUDIX hydrolase [Candidatus Saccharimonadales bacterium]|nr:NUDIX hydrolase [Candidatus Saccharimonadales bacterium]
MRTIYRTIVSAIIISKDGKILLGKKDPKRQIYDLDCWHIPGGGVDDGETLEEGLRREMLEEVGIDINDCSVKLVDDKGKGEAEKILNSGEKVLAKMKFNVFRVDIDKNASDVKTSLNDDLIDIKWVEIKDLPKYKQTPPSVELFKRINFELETFNN